MTDVERRLVQGGVLCGYGFPRAAHVFVRFPDGASGRRWLGGLPPLTSAAPWSAGKPPSTCNVAFSVGGLELLGLPRATLDALPDDVRQGMRARAARNGDVGPDDPRHWQAGLDDRAAHAVVTVHVRDDDAAALAQAVAGLRVPDAWGPVVETMAVLGQEREHFGFRDGLAQPALADELGPWHGTGTPRPGRGTPSWEPVAVGEFLLGHDDEDGDRPAPPPAPLDRDTTYLVLRKLQQHVGVWRAWTLEAAGGDPDAAVALSAKLVGRWPNGTPVARCPDGPDPELDDPALWRRDLDEAGRHRRFRLLNDFGYAGDEDGRRCPLTAHVRRAGPRDAFGDGRRVRRHRIIRRGMPYGPPLAAGAPDDGQERGLWFASFQASIERQFELLQRDWLNDGDAFGLGDDPDVVAGTPVPGTKAVVQGEPARVLGGLPRVVALRGGGYFVVPSIPAVAELAHE